MTKFVGSSLIRATDSADAFASGGGDVYLANANTFTNINTFNNGITNFGAASPLLDVKSSTTGVAGLGKVQFSDGAATISGSIGHTTNSAYVLDIYGNAGINLSMGTASSEVAIAANATGNTGVNLKTATATDAYYRVTQNSVDKGYFGYKNSVTATGIFAPGTVKIDGTTGVRLYYNNVEKLYADSFGVAVTGRLQTTTQLLVGTISEFVGAGIFYESTAFALDQLNTGIVVGDSTAINIVADNTGFQARNAGLAATLNLNRLGGTIQFGGMALLPVATTTRSSLRMPAGTAPTSPINGDMWSTTAGFYGRVNGVTVGPFGSGSGTVTSVSVTTAAGVSGSVATSTTTPAITITLGAITPTSVAASGLLSGTTGTFTDLLLTAASVAGSAGIRVPHGAAPTAPTNGDLWSTTAGFYGRVNGATVGPFGAGGGSGTVTSVSVTTAAGVSGSVATSTTTPAITITLGAITPTSVAASGSLSGTTGTFTDLLLTAASVAGSAGIRVPHGAAPTAPTNGDLWSTTAGFYGRVNGATVGPFGAGGGSSAPTINIRTGNSTETATSGVIVVIATDAVNQTINLPTAVGNTAMYHVKKTNAGGAVTIDPNGSQTIDGGLTATLNVQWESLLLVSDNTNWMIL